MSMKDSMNTLFQQRFQGHEAPVDAGVWEGIQQQLIAAAPAADAVNDLFRERFQGHETPVDPSAWANISGQLGHSAAAGGVGSAWAWVASGVAAVVVTAATVLWEPGQNTAQQATAVVEQTNSAPASRIQPAAADREVEPATAASEKAPAPKVRMVKQAAPKQKPSEDRAKAVEPASTPASEQLPLPLAIDGPGTEKDGPAVVSEIITVLEEQVKQQPLTAEPEPGSASKPANTTKTNNEVSIDGGPSGETIETTTQPALPKLFMPNTFTPNGDGVNDTYMVDGASYAALFVRVYSLKSNALVFSTNSGEPWTGDGCEDGMYMVAVEAHTAEGRTTTEGKVVWLNRNRIN
jgi:outer membrane biosynthesis protein TonB